MDASFAASDQHQQTMLDEVMRTNHIAGDVAEYSSANTLIGDQQSSHYDEHYPAAAASGEKAEHVSGNWSSPRTAVPDGAALPVESTSSLVANSNADGSHGNFGPSAGANDPLVDQQQQSGSGEPAAPATISLGHNNNATATGNEAAKIVVPPSSLPVFPTTTQHSLSSGELFQHGSQKSPNAEIDKGSIKEQLHEIISEIEMDLSKQQQTPRLLQPLPTSTQQNTHHQHVPASAEAAETNHFPELATARPFGTTVDNSDTTSLAERHYSEQENSIQLHRPLPQHQPQQQPPPPTTTVTTEKYHLHQPAQHHHQETQAPPPTLIIAPAQLMTMTPADCASSDAFNVTSRHNFLSGGMSNNPHDRLSSSSVTMLESPSLPFRAKRVGLMSPASSGSSRNNRYSWQPPSWARPTPNTTWDGAAVSSHTMPNNNDAPVAAPSSVVPTEPMMGPQGLTTAAADAQQQTAGGELITDAAAMEQPSSAATAPWQEHGADSNKENVPITSSMSKPSWAPSSSEAGNNDGNSHQQQNNADYVQADDQHHHQHASESSSSATTRMEEAAEVEQYQLDEEEDGQHQHQQERRVSLEKLMQPASDALLATPRRRKMFGSSSFYNEPRNMYPTVEEQFELARRISESLVAEDNKTSKGQTMYVKRKKRSVKWITQGPEGLLEPPPLTDSKTVDASSFLVPDAAGNGAPSNDDAAGFTAGPGAYQQDWAAGAPAHHSTASNGEGASHQQQQTLIGSADGSSGNSSTGKPCLKFVLNPVQVRDALSTRNSAIYNDHTKLSPDVFLDLVKDLNSPTGKGAQLFAKRKKKAEKWIVDETTVLASNNLASSLLQAQTHQEVTSSTTTTSYDSFSTSSLVDQQQPNTCGTGKTPLAQLIEQQNAEIQRRLEHLNSKVKLVKSPWEAALETGYVDSAFAKQQQQETPASAAVPLMMQQASHMQQHPHQPSAPTMGYTTWSPSCAGVPPSAMGTSMAPSLMMEQPSTETPAMGAPAASAAGDPMMSKGHPLASTFSPVMTHRNEQQEPEDSLMGAADAGNYEYEEEAAGGVVIGRVQLRPGRSQQRQQHQQQRRPVSMRERSYDSIYNTCPRGWDPNWLSEIPRSIHRPTFVPCTAGAAGGGGGHSGADVGHQNEPPSTKSGNSNIEMSSFPSMSSMMRRLSAEAPAAAPPHRHHPQQQHQQLHHQRQGVIQAPSTAGVSTQHQRPLPLHNNQQRLLLNRTLDERATSFAAAHHQQQQQQQQHYLPPSFSADGHRQQPAPSTRVTVNNGAADGLLLDASMDTAMTKRRDEDDAKYKRRSMIADFGNLNNYNTLPRGWGRPSAAAKAEDVAAGGGGSSRGTINASSVRTCSPAPAAYRHHHHHQQQQPMTPAARPGSGYYKPCQFFTHKMNH